MTDEQLLNSLQGTMATIDPYSVTFKVNCLSCAKLWVGKSRLDETNYEEVKND